MRGAASICVGQLVAGLIASLASISLALAVPAARATSHRRQHCRPDSVLKHVRIQVRTKEDWAWVPVWRCVTKTPKASSNPFPSPQQEPAPSLFGINTASYDSSHANFLNDFPTAQALGARWDHFVLTPATAIGNYSTIDLEVQQAKQHGMGVVLSFAGIASACSQSTTPISSCPPTTSSDLSNYQTYVKNILARYHNVVDYYESWVEPNTEARWLPAANPGQYAALLKAQYRAFQQFNGQRPGSGPSGSNMKLLFGSPNGFTIQPPDSSIAVLPYTEQVLDALGGAKPFDGIALHPYRYPPSEGPNDPGYDWVGGLKYPPSSCRTGVRWCQLTWTQELQAYEQEFTDHGYGQPPMWLTEFGWPGGGEVTSPYCQSNQGYCLATGKQAAELRAAYGDLRQLPFVQAALWFNLRDYQPGITSPDPQFFYRYGLLNYDYSHKPAADTFQSLAAASPDN
jgi:hypothetical protein